MPNSPFELSQTGADLFFPNGNKNQESLEKTTHLGVGAHQDDLEFMAMHGIGQCFEKEDHWFGGITCTNGAGSSRVGEFANTTDLEMQGIRAEEQRTAARIGQYSFIAQLNYPSSDIKDPQNKALENELFQILERTQPGVVYTHNLADKHASHIAVVCATIKAIRRLAPEKRPAKVIGCEVWRDLDWMPDELKVVMDLSAFTELSAKLNAVFVSQIAGGKRYDLAIEGRRRANATLFDSHSSDNYQSVAFGMDLSPLITDKSLDPTNYTLKVVKQFEQDIRSQVERYF